MGGTVSGASNTVANVKNQLTTKNSNMSISETKLESVAEVYQQILNEAVTELTTKQKITTTTETTTKQTTTIGNMSNKGTGNKNIVSQESTVSNSTTLSLLANTFASSEFDIQQKFLLARAMQLTNDNVSATAVAQATAKESTSNTGTNPDLACQASVLFGFNNCVSNVQNILNTINETEIRNILNKTNKELTSITQDNVVSVVNYINNVITNVNIHNTIMDVTVDSMTNDGTNNKNEIAQKNEVMSKLVNEIVATVNNNAVHSSASESSSTLDENTTNKNDTSTTVDQTTTSKTKITNTVIIVVAVVLGIVLVLGIGFGIKYYKDKQKKENENNESDIQQPLLNEA